MHKKNVANKISKRTTPHVHSASSGVPKSTFFGSLSTRIMFAFVTLISVVLAIVVLLVSLTLRLYLTDEVDRSLISSGRIVAGQTVDQIVNGSQGQVVPSDFYFYVDLNYNNPITVSHPDYQAAYGSPADPGKLVAHSGGQSLAPFTSRGTLESVKWRVLIVPLQSAQSGTSSGTVLIALPLASVDLAVANMAQMMIALMLIIILLGALISYFLAQKTLAGVRTIERVTNEVAAGNLSSRVPELPQGTEVGELSTSINTMLASIEHAFTVKEESEQRMRQFVSDASHELRTPLATVRGYAELYRMGGVPKDQVGHAFERVESEATRMGNLVEDLLKLARLDERRGLNLERVDLLTTARNAVDDFLARAPERTASVIGLDGGAPVPIAVMADADKVSQVIANLLGNVLTHTAPSVAVEVAVGINPVAKNEAIIEVRDHGQGVAQKDAAKIFERFYRTDSSRSRDTGGSGLGLSIVAATLAAHGGTARVSETLGGGLTVTLTFPNVVPTA